MKEEDGSPYCFSKNNNNNLNKANTMFISLFASVEFLLANAREAANIEITVVVDSLL